MKLVFRSPVFSMPVFNPANFEAAVRFLSIGGCPDTSRIANPSCYNIAIDNIRFYNRVLDDGRINIDNIATNISEIGELYYTGVNIPTQPSLKYNPLTRRYFGESTSFGISSDHKFLGRTYYETNGSNPNEFTSPSITYSDESGLTINKTTTVKYFYSDYDPYDLTSIQTVNYNFYLHDVQSSITETEHGTPISFPLSHTGAIPPNTNIYYTLDGSTPNQFSELYTQPIEISESKTVKAIS